MQHVTHQQKQHEEEEEHFGADSNFGDEFSMPFLALAARQMLPICRQLKNFTCFGIKRANCFKIT